ncbi:hypothetical protein JTB14_026243 [Gonioctena quinquepunctata]|nr:hypothetical protein JTB14_026243 [Gonioctena quinquepunctata]
MDNTMINEAFKLAKTLSIPNSISSATLISHRKNINFHHGMRLESNCQWIGLKIHNLLRDGTKILKNRPAIDYGSFDFIIVGRGTAGTVLANRLSEIRSWKILLLEAGGLQDEFSDVPAFAGYLYKTPLNWGYHSTPQKTCCQGMREKKCTYPRGEALGGSGVINIMIYARGSPTDFDTWARLGNKGWSFGEVLPYFKKSELVNLANYDHQYHGTEGLLHVNVTAPPSVISVPFLRACEERGLKQVDYNGKEHLGVSRIQYNINFNKRDNGAHAFIDPIMHSRLNLNITINAPVTRISLDGRVARGVEFIKDGRRYIAKSRREVISSAGSINSPQLLMLSGIGPRDVLRKFHIEVKNELPVGKNLKDHPMLLNLVFRSNRTAPFKTLKDNLRAYIRGETPLTNSIGCEYIGFINTKTPGQGIPDIEFILSSPPLGILSDPEVYYNVNNGFAEVFRNYNTLTDFSLFVILLNPKSTGWVSLQSDSPLDFPIINNNFLSDDENNDIETMYQGVKFLLSLTETEAFRSINATYIGNQLGCEEYRKRRADREYWYCAIRNITTSVFHPVGTTRMGRTPKNSVVDSHCLVHNMDNLRVVDAGVMPEIIRGHTNAPTFMIAEKISECLTDEDLDDIINYDETNLTDDPGQVEVVVLRGVKRAFTVMDNSISSTSLMFAVTASGRRLPPYIVYKAKNVYPEWLLGEPANCFNDRSRTGWFDNVIFEDWYFKVVIPYFRYRGGKMAIIGDDLASHLSTKIIEECESNDIMFIFLPPNSTHVCQPRFLFQTIKNSLAQGAHRMENEKPWLHSKNTIPKAVGGNVREFGE